MAAFRSSAYTAASLALPMEVWLAGQAVAGVFPSGGADVEALLRVTQLSQD